jgi:HK97 family phage portal protein
MGFFRRFLAGLSGSGYRTRGLQTGEPLSMQDTATPVTMDSALQLSAVWACVNIISESIGSLPLHIYKIDRETGEKSVDLEHPLQRLFSHKPNRWQTRQEFFETITYQLVLLGNNFSAIERNGRGDIVSLIPLMSRQMEVALEDD